jgi:UDP-N-acetylmuramate dehydrogenase
LLCLEEIHERLPKTPVYADEPMSRHTSFAIGGPADLLILPRDTDELVAIIRLADTSGTPVFLMGNGTNLLVSDRGIRGLVVKTYAGLCRVARRGECQILADGGVLLSKLASAAAKWGLSGLAFAQGIPGTVGGAVCMNAGAYNGQMSQVVSRTDFVDETGRLGALTGSEHLFSYRHSYFTEHPEAIVCGAVFTLTPGAEADIRSEMEDFAARRRASQPLELPSAGSVFKRPAGQFAGTMIAECGLKGMRVGGAQISEKHAGFIVNTGGATCEDVRRLIAIIQETVYRVRGIRLETEIKMVGEQIYF